MQAAGSIQALSKASGISRPTISLGLRGAAVSERTASKLRAAISQSPKNAGVQINVIENLSLNNVDLHPCLDDRHIKEVGKK